MQTIPNPRTARFLTPALLASLLAASTTHSALGQNPGDPLQDPFPQVSTSFETRQLPVAPWLMPSTPPLPDWLEVPYPQNPLQMPGLGTASFGDNPLQPATSTRTGRSRGVSGSTPFPVGPIDISFDVSYGLTYGTGLLSGPVQDEESFRHSLTPAINLFAGDRWSIRYAPSLNFFSADGFDNTVDHSVRLAGSASAPGWDFGLNHASSVSSTPLIETGRQTDQTLHVSGLSANWDVNGKDALTFALSQTIRFADGSPDAYSWVNQNWYERPLTDVISAALGVGVGYDLLDPGTDMVYERLNGRVQGSLGSKVTYSVAGGAEFRQFAGSDSPANISPLVSASLTYQVLDKTSLFAAFDHSIGTSYFTDQFTENSSISAGLTQILSQKWSATVAGGFRSTAYQSSLNAEIETRDDKSSFASCSISWRAMRRLTASLSYSFRSNESDQTGFEFDSHQVGLRLTYGL